MAEKLGEYGAAYKYIGDAVKTAKSLEKDQNQLQAIIEETKKQAEGIESLNISGISQSTVNQLKNSAHPLRDAGCELGIWQQNFCKKVRNFDALVSSMIQDGAIPPSKMKQFCEELQLTYDMTKDFSSAFDTFMKHLDQTKETALKLNDELKQKETQEQADSNRNWGAAAAAAAGTVALGTAAVALGFFTGGATWLLAAGAIAASAGAIGVGAMTAKIVSEMRDIANRFLKDASRLQTLANDLKAIQEKAGRIQLSKEMVNNLRSALEFLRRDSEKDRKIDEKDRKIAELEAKLKALGH